MKKVYLSVAALLIISNVASANTVFRSSSDSAGPNGPYLWEAKAQGTGPLTCATRDPMNLHYVVTSFVINAHGKFLGGANITCNGVNGNKQIHLAPGATYSECTIKCNTMQNPDIGQYLEIDSDKTNANGAEGIMRSTFEKPNN